MTRSNWKNKNFIFKNNLLKQIDNNNKIKFWNKNVVISENLINRQVEIYNGLKFVPLLIKEEMINFKLGSFVRTKKLCVFKKEKKKKNKLKKK